MANTIAVCYSNKYWLVYSWLPIRFIQLQTEIQKEKQMSELNKSLDELETLTDNLEEDTDKAVSSLRDLMGIWDIDSSSVDELETQLKEVVQQLRELIGDYRV